jgi:hypothetical protein
VAVLVGTHDGTGEIVAGWPPSADEVTLVVPFAAELDDLLALFDAAVTTKPGTDGRHS